VNNTIKATVSKVQRNTTSKQSVKRLKFTNSEEARKTLFELNSIAESCEVEEKELEAIMPGIINLLEEEVNSLDQYENGMDFINNTESTQGASSTNGTIQAPKTQTYAHLDNGSKQLDCPLVEASSSIQKERKEPQVVTRSIINQRRKVATENRVNAIVFDLSNEQLNFFSRYRPDTYVKEKLKVQLDSRRGSSGCTILGNRLFVYPLTEGDHDKIIRNKNWSLANNSQTSLENKGNCFILKGLSVNEIERNEHIANDLKQMGVLSWTPLIGKHIKEANDHVGVRCETSNRAELCQILTMHYANGKKYDIGQNEVVEASFDPMCKQPRQCFNCNKWTNHLAKECRPEEEKCKNCGMKAHTVKNEECTLPSICSNCPANCKDGHGSRDWWCPTRQNLMLENLNLNAFYATGLNLKRMPKNGKARFSEVVKRNLEATKITDNFNVWKSGADSKVYGVEKRVEQEMDKFRGDVGAIKMDAATCVLDMKEVIKISREAVDKIGEHMDRMVEARIKETESRLEKVENNSKQNLNYILRLNEATGTWKSQSDARLAKVESFIGKFKNSWSGEAFWDSQE
jgi:hypothetical protein